MPWCGLGPQVLSFPSCGLLNPVVTPKNPDFCSIYVLVWFRSPGITLDRILCHRNPITRNPMTRQYVYITYDFVLHLCHVVVYSYPKTPVLQPLY
jgi:hypothetical protein